MRTARIMVVGVVLVLVCGGADAQERRVADFLLPQVAQKLLLPDDKWSWERGKDDKAVLVFTAKDKEEAGGVHSFRVQLADVDKRLQKQLRTRPYMITVVFEGKFKDVVINGRWLSQSMAELKDKERLSGEFEVGLYRGVDKEQLFLRGQPIKDFKIQRDKELWGLRIEFRFPKDTETATVRIKTLKIEY